MIRKIISIDEEKCNGCGLCERACHEGAIKVIDGKAKLTRDDFCDGFGDCLPACPQNAISFTEREALSYDEDAVLNAKLAKSAPVFSVSNTVSSNNNNGVSMLGNWPCQIKLAPVNAPYYNNADILIAADCTAYAYADMHREFMNNKVTLIGCPKLDSIDYSEKLSMIFAANSIKSVHLVRMTVPCCGGMQAAIGRAIEKSGKDIEFTVSVISIDGKKL